MHLLDKYPRAGLLAILVVASFFLYVGSQIVVTEATQETWVIE
jgi:hypothetical protein